MRELYYIYPFEEFGAFRDISKRHIKVLRRYYRIQEVDREVLDTICWVAGKNLILHPIFYTFIPLTPREVRKKEKRLRNVLNVKDLLIGFDVADSERISDKAVEIANHFDYIFVPSRHSMIVFYNSEVEKPVFVIPHGLDKAYLNPPTKVYSPQLQPIYQLKKRGKAILILYFLMHSGYRKGADLVAKVVKPIQDRYRNVYLVVKRAKTPDPYMLILRLLKTIEIAGELSLYELIQLYDLCDILVVPSRGGGFELNALEGLARGCITLAPDAGCFLDYKADFIRLDWEPCEIVLKNNPIHVGGGHQVLIDDFKEKLVNVIDNLSSYKRKFIKQAKKIAEVYQWDRVGEELIGEFKRGGII